MTAPTPFRYLFPERRRRDTQRIMGLGGSLTYFGEARGDTKAKRPNLVTIAALLLTVTGARAEENIPGFANVSEPQSTTPAEDWGPVPTGKASIANLAPVLLPYFNNGPVFGLPGTVTGNFWDQTQLTGDWGGLRTEITKRGLFIDLYSTSAYQDVTSGGLKTGTAFLQNMQLVDQGVGQKGHRRPDGALWRAS
jgi:hypothetical protein